MGLDDDWGWKTDIPGLDGITMRADNHIFDVNCAKADDLTKAEQLGRQKAYALERLIRKYANPACRIVSLCSHIGIRETYHYKTDFTADEQSLLTGVLYDDAILTEPTGWIGTTARIMASHLNIWMAGKRACTVRETGAHCPLERSAKSYRRVR